MALSALVLPTWLIALIGIVLVAGLATLGVLAWKKDRQEDASRLVTGALVAFTVLIVQLMIDARAHHDSQRREAQANHEALLLQLGRQKDLSGIDLRAQNLSGFYLGDKTLNGANLPDAVMKDVALDDAHLVSANLAGADLRGAHLDGADLRQADLAGADLRGAWLGGAVLDAATLSPGWDGAKKKLVPTDLTGAHLRTTYLRGDLRHALLKDADMYGAHLAPANLSFADLMGADLTLADLRGANLVGADLHTAKLGEVLDLSYATYDHTTRWPPGFSWPGLQNPCNAPCCRSRAPCQLGVKAVNDFPPRMRVLRDELVKLTQEKHCPAGWRTDSSDPFKLQLVSTRGLAHFRVEASMPTGMTARAWAASFRPKTNARAIPGVAMDLGEAYADRYSQGSGRSRREEVGVYQIYNGGGLRYWASASSALFALYERDFAELFRAVGVTPAGTRRLFPEFRGGAEGCA